ncbi:hypothetical protein ACRAWF_03345 [Streptomyces sp. L7]
MFVGPQRKPTFLGGINGMIVGLVAITPAAGFVSGIGAIYIGIIASSIVWLAWNYLSKVPPFNKVDDALGVVYTHGIAGLAEAACSSASSPTRRSPCTSTRTAPRPGPPAAGSTATSTSCGNRRVRPGPSSSTTP